jgi:hypothetical protein
VLVDLPTAIGSPAGNFSLSPWSNLSSSRRLARGRRMQASLVLSSSALLNMILPG